MFESFRKRKLMRINDTTIEELRKEFEQERRAYALIANHELFKFFVEYFEAKIELNRDKLELLDAYKETDRPQIAELRAENKVMRDLINDVEDMKKVFEAEAEIEKKEKSALEPDRGS